jgi:tRNA threonylcarbamoyladenosine biosynthesis protein TsaE
VSRQIVSRSQQETETLGAELAEKLSATDVVYLVGDLGAGKTTLARGLARGLGADARDVASPTFALLHEYVGGAGAVVLRHLDLYRLADRESDLDVLGLPGAVSGAPIAVEWPNDAIRRLLPPTLEIRIRPEADGSRRIEEFRSS